MRIELRSDTFTLPTVEMKAAMFNAQVGDDVFREDSAINHLEAKAAALFGREAALFCPSGTMTNQIAINVHTRPGDEVICDAMSHVYIYEGAGIAFNSGCQVRTIAGDRGRISVNQVEEAIQPDDIHKARTKVVSIENTTNRGGGACYALEDLLHLKTLCKQHQLAFHCDGARIWNAMVAQNIQPTQMGELFDSLSVCLSKGLGAPVGSLLIGDATFIKEARRVRKKLGGGMRQAGFLAAAGTYALDHHFPLLALDHLRTTAIAETLAALPFVHEILPPATNILIFSLQNGWTATAFCQYLSQLDIHCLPISAKQVRMVFHLDVTDAMVTVLFQTLQSMPTHF